MMVSLILKVLLLLMSAVKAGEAIGLYNYDSTSNVADTFRARVSSESDAWQQVF